MGHSKRVLGLIAAALVTVAAPPTLTAERTDPNRAVTAPILVVQEGTRAAFEGSPIARSGPQRIPALTVFAAAQPRPLSPNRSPNRSPDMDVSGRVYSAESGHETVMLAELPWSLDAKTGRMTTAIVIGVRNAVAVQAGLSVEGHTAPLELRFVGSAEDSELVLDDPVTMRPGKNATVWSATLTGPVMVVELTRLDSQTVPPSGVLRVLHIVDVFDIGGPRSDVSSQKSSGGSVQKTAGDCFFDAVCETSVEYQPLAAAVAFLAVTKADGVYQCSGALINDTSSSGRARVLTAGHCVDGALSITAYFKYRSIACNGASPSLLSLPRTSALVTTIWNDSLDYALVVYSELAPAGTVLLGWDTSSLVLGDELVDIHHAGGGTQSLLWSTVAALRDVFSVGGQTLGLPRYDSIYSDVGARGGASGSNFVERDPQGTWGVIRGILSFGPVDADLSTCPSDGTKFGLTAHGAEFGQIYPGIQSELETPTPPTVSLSANPTSITTGESSTLIWSSTNATSCTASGGWSGARATSGSETTGALSITKDFTLTCTGSGGEASRTITVTVAAATVSVPNVVNQTQSAATTAITGAGLVVGTVSQQSSLTVPSGSVISQSPNAGTSVATGSAVNLVVSTGPAPTPAPTVSLSAYPAILAAGASGTLEWSSTNATACMASGGWSGARTTGNSTQAIGPLFATTGFTLTCTGSGGTASSSVTIVVTAPPPPPSPTVSISANPTNITTGASSTLTWSSTNATSCTASGGWSGARTTSGSVTTGALSATTAFALTCTGPGGTGSNTVTVTVTAPSAPTVSLSASPTSIAAGESSTLTWSSTNATSCTSSNGWSGTSATSGSATTGALSVTTAFTMTCTGFGGTGSQTVTVSVTPPPKKSGGGGGATDYALLAMLLGVGLGLGRKTKGKF